MVDFYAIEAVDTAKLIFFIYRSDATFVKIDNDKYYIQAKLNAIDDEDMTSNG